MSDLADLDRPAITYHCQAWDRDVVLRPIGAWDLLQLNHDFEQVHGENADSEDMVRFYAELLAVVCEDPKAGADAWLRTVRLDTLLELGQQAARVSGLLVEEKKSE